MRTFAIILLFDILILGASVPSQAASIDPIELNDLRDKVRNTDAVSVSVHLFEMSLSELRNGPNQIRAKAISARQKLYAELGSSALKSGRKENGLGQLSMYVDAKGIEKLRASINAKSFTIGGSWRQYTHIQNYGDALDKIDASLDALGYVDLDVVLNVEELEFDWDTKGEVKFSTKPNFAKIAANQMKSFMNDFDNLEMQGKSTALQNLSALDVGGAASPLVSIRVNREGFLKLIDNEIVRNLYPKGFVDNRPFAIDPEALKIAAKNGSVDILLESRNIYWSPKLSAQTLLAQKNSNRKSLNQILRNVTAKPWSHDLSEIGTLAIRLSEQELKFLISNNDNRLLSVTANKPIATPQLYKSVPTMNVSPVWVNTGHAGEGQNIFILDTGVDISHPMLAGHVSSAACFGTNDQHYMSKCPNQNAQGDSLPGTVNSAAPISWDAWGAHGTELSGIAAGNGLYKGVAPGATIFGVQINSMRRAPVANENPLAAYNFDVLLALQAIYSYFPANGTIWPSTVSMSFAGFKSDGSPYTSSCGNWIDSTMQSYVNIIALLKQAGIPVVAAAGNNGFRNGIGFPACIPGVIKVSAAENDGVGNTVASYSNAAPPSSFPGETMWLAPGGGGSYPSNWIYTTSVIAVGGTSHATPHIAGLYALVKSVIPSVTVQGWNDFFKQNAAIYVNVPGGASAYSLPRIRLPY